MRLFAICRLWPQAWMKMPPPPCELLVMPKPSMLEGLHRKLLGYGLLPSGAVQSLAVSSRVPVGNEPAAVPPAPKMFVEPVGNTSPLASTVMPAPSNAPIRAGSCSSSARLPFCSASQPITASRGSRSTCGLSDPSVLLVIALFPAKPCHPFPGQVYGPPPLAV